MPMYCFCFEAEPTGAARHAHGIKAGHVNLFVTAASLALAEVRAREHLLNYGWIPTKVLIAQDSTPAQIARLDRGLVALHRKAERDGVALEFVAWPKTERAGDGVEIRSMGPPVIDENKKH